MLHLFGNAVSYVERERAGLAENLLSLLPETTFAKGRHLSGRAVHKHSVVTETSACG